MTSPFHRTRSTLIQMSLRQNRVRCSWLIRPPRAVTDENHLAMVGAGSAFGTHQIIFTVPLIDMGRLNPDRLFRNIHTTINNNFVGSGNNLILLYIVIPNFDYAMTFVQFFSLIGRIVMHLVSLAIVVKEKCRIDPAKVYFDRI